jgi:uncharacterized protein YjaZ
MSSPARRAPFLVWLGADQRMLAGKALAAHDAHHLLKLDALMADWCLAKFLDQILAAGIDTRHGHAPVGLEFAILP